MPWRCMNALETDDSTPPARVVRRRAALPPWGHPRCPGEWGLGTDDGEVHTRSGAAPAPRYHRADGHVLTIAAVPGCRATGTSPTEATAPASRLWRALGHLSQLQHSHCRACINLTTRRLHCHRSSREARPAEGAVGPPRGRCRLPRRGGQAIGMGRADGPPRPTSSGDSSS